ncbi:hypothetical protein SUDANB6_05803 [Streptomyces sp. enrichment culture]|uniref:DDE-type integrase/transposase/recombinase n=1 Tax=Streptomyces sp. enrichment culture TaxID=1795815 RepID=UPI003F5547E2
MRAPDPAERDLAAPAPNRTWVADFTHVAAWAGTVYVAFAVDTSSRRIVGWSAVTSKHTELVLTALEMSLRQRDRTGTRPEAGEVTHHSDAGSQDTSFALAEHPDRADVAASIGSVGDALTEPATGLCRTDPIKPRRPGARCPKRPPEPSHAACSPASSRLGGSSSGFTSATDMSRP